VGDRLIAFEAEVVGAVGDGRLRVRLYNGHVLDVEAAARPGTPAFPGEQGLAALAPGPTARWRFIACPRTPPERPWPKKT
jgi:hypothetical protein